MSTPRQPHSAGRVVAHGVAVVAAALATATLLNACAEILNPSPPDEMVVFPDSGLETAIRDAIEKPLWEGNIYASDLAGLWLLPAGGRDISDLEGIQYCLDLTSLYLSHNQIVDITPLAPLTALTVLWIHENQIVDVSPLSGLSSLESLWLQGNQIDDISPLIDNDGLGSGDLIIIRSNYLDLGPGSSDMQEIQELLDRGAQVLYEPQKD